MPRHPARSPLPRRASLTLAALALAVVAAVLPSTAALAVPGTPGTPGAPGDDGDKKPAEPKAWTGYPGTNVAHDTYGYPWSAAPDCDESNVGTGGCVNDGLGFFQGQCTSWVAYRMGQRNGVAFSNWYAGVHWGNASEWATVAKSVDIAANKVPAVGAIGWYARGHVSYVEAVNTDGSVVVSEMNTDGHNGFHLTTVYPGATGWPDKFIHVADIVPVDYTAPEVPGSPAADPVRSGVEVTWDPSSDDLGTTGYTVLRDGTPLAETDTASYVDRRASADQGYTYTVRAHDAAGNVSGPATARVVAGEPAPKRLARPYLPGTARLVDVDGAELACGLLGKERDQRVGCTRRTSSGPVVERAGREVEWGTEDSRRFLAGDDGRAWFCRDLVDREGTRHACAPFDPATRSWGFDRVDSRRGPLLHPTWVVTPSGPAACGLVAARPSCSVVRDEGWDAPRRAAAAAPGDPLSRVFVGTDRGPAYCRVVEGHAACTELGARGVWRRDAVTRREVGHGRWSTVFGRPTLCPVEGDRCVTVGSPA